MRSEALNTSIIQLVYLWMVIVKDRKGEECGVCC